MKLDSFIILYSTELLLYRHFCEQTFRITKIFCSSGDWSLQLKQYQNTSALSGTINANQFILKHLIHFIFIVHYDTTLTMVWTKEADGDEDDAYKGDNEEGEQNEAPDERGHATMKK
jgi:hypothetical protein